MSEHRGERFGPVARLQQSAPDRGRATPEDCELLEQRLDETAVSEGTPDVLISATRVRDDDSMSAEGAAAWFGLDPDAPDLAFWDVYDAVLEPGDMILQTAWRDATEAAAFAASDDFPEAARSASSDRARLQHV
jgi:hypothetical protein